MAWSSISRTAGLALGVAWAFAAAAQSSTGSPLSQRPLEGRVVNVDRQDHSLLVDTTERAHARPAAVAEGTAPTYHRRRRVAAHERGTAWSGDVERAPNAKLQIASNATVIRDGLNVPLAEVRPGDEVRAIFLTDDLTRTHPWKVEVRSPHGREAPWGVDTGG